MGSGSSRSFYRDLPAVPAGVGLCDLSLHRDVPGDWCVVIVDIVSSTVAIERGQYKDVNTVSASAITAVLNAAGREDVAYIFGGDGATLLIPAELTFDVAGALYGARQMAKEAFNLDMRAGIVFADELMKAGAPVRVAKMQAAKDVVQASLSGEGIALAERLVKGVDTSPAHDIEKLFSPKVLAAKPADFRGLECRWQPLHSRNGFDVSLIALARGGDPVAQGAIYRDILSQIDAICGKAEDWRPVSAQQLNLSGDPKRLAAEARVQSAGKGRGKLIAELTRVCVSNAIGRLCLACGLKIGSFDGRVYRKATAQNTDYIKFDNALRLVMDVSAAQKEALAAYLDGLVAQGRAWYGMHSAPAALMTCLVFDYASAHMHFVDGAGGGYALAAKAMKQQMKDLAAPKAA